MEDILLINYLRDRGILDDSEYSKLMQNKKVHDMSTSEIPSFKSDKYSKFFDNFKEVTKDMNISEKDKFIDRLKEYDNKSVEHFNESYAKYIVSNMWHKDTTGKKHMGEKYDMLKAKEICERYRGIIPMSVTPSDIYIAINNQYHNYHCLFNKWFGNDIDYQIIESAIVYWFKDESHGMSKLWEHFKNK